MKTPEEIAEQIFADWSKEWEDFASVGDKDIIPLIAAAIQARDEERLDVANGVIEELESQLEEREKEHQEALDRERNLFLIEEGRRLGAVAELGALRAKLADLRRFNDDIWKELVKRGWAKLSSGGIASLIDPRTLISNPVPRCPTCGEETTYRTPDRAYWCASAHHWKTTESTEAEQLDALRKELADCQLVSEDMSIELDKLLEAARLVKGSRDVHNVYEVLDLIPALRKAGLELLTAMETCHICQGTLVPEDGPIHCEDCSSDCEDHEGEPCISLSILRRNLGQLIGPELQPAGEPK